MAHNSLVEKATSLERFLNRSVIFIQGIDQQAPKSEVLQVLNQVLKAPQQGRIDILTGPDGRNRGTAFLNFHNKEDAAAALERWRFGLELRGKQLKMQFSSDREFKDVIQGPLTSRFKVLVRNLPEELGQEELYDKYLQYGEILQLHYSCDAHGTYFAIIQYLEVASVQAAIRATNREKVYSHVLLVEQYKPSTTYGPLPKNINHPSYQYGQQQQPHTSSYANGGGGAAAGAAGGHGVSTGSGGGGGLGSPLQGMTYAALQQQQEREAEEAAVAAAAAAEAEAAEAAYHAAYGGAGGAAAVEGGSAGGGGAVLAVPSFYAASATAAAGPLPGAGANAAASLTSLLTAALHHVSTLDELLCCPITQEPLRDPVVAADGNTYERIAIEAWLRKSDTSPLTNEAMPHKSLVPNNLVRKIVEDLKPRAHSDSGGAAAAASRPSALGGATAAAAEQAEASYGSAAGSEATQLVVPIPVPAPAAAPPPEPQHELEPEVWPEQPPPPAAAARQQVRQQPQQLYEQQPQQQHHGHIHQVPQPQQQFVLVPHGRGAVHQGVHHAVHHHGYQQPHAAYLQQHQQQQLAAVQAQQQLLMQQQQPQQPQPQTFATYQHQGTTYYM